MSVVKKLLVGIDAAFASAYNADTTYFQPLPDTFAGTGLLCKAWMVR